MIEMQIVPTLTAVASVAILAAGCGSSSPPKSATGSTGSFQSAIAQADRYSTCMRQHGLTDFPDPRVSSSPGHQGIAIQAVGSGPVFATAQKACGHILPAPSNADIAAQAAQRRVHAQDLLSFARCMRGRGIGDFPDPDAEGDLTTEMITAAGVDLHAPQTGAAARACIPASHGILTPALVAQATGSSG
jgi:hypothetical protein